MLWCGQAIGQQPALRVQAISHPSTIERIVVVRPVPKGEMQLIYQADDSLIFERKARRRAVSLDSRIVSVEVSDGQQHLALITQPATTDATGHFHVYDATGQRRFTSVFRHETDLPYPVLAVSDATGAVAYGHPPTGQVVFLDASGEVHREVQLFKDAPFSLEKSLHVAYSPDGRHVAVAAMRAPAKPRDSTSQANAHLFLFRSDGILQWRKPLPEQALQALSFSGNGEQIAVASYDAYVPEGVIRRSRVYASNGRLLLSAPHGFERAVFGPSEVLFVTNNSAEAYTLTDGQQQFAYRPVRRNVQIVDADTGLNGGQVALLLGESRYTNEGFVFEDPHLLILNRKGQQVAVSSLQVHAVRAPRLRIRQNGPVVVTNQKTLLIDWP